MQAFQRTMIYRGTQDGRNAPIDSIALALKSIQKASTLVIRIWCIGRGHIPMWGMSNIMNIANLENHNYIYVS